jgi:predicted DsbA family dithiol-disulfide isomerase
MLFQGRVYYDFSLPVWRFYRFLTAAANEGADLRLEWCPYLAGADPQSAEGCALVEAVRERFPDRHGAYLQALLALRHLEGADVTDPTVSSVAAASAGIDGPVVPDHGAVERSTAEGVRLGVAGTPTIFRHGPVLQVGVNPAAYTGDLLERLRLIDAVLDDDGIWLLAKP